MIVDASALLAVLLREPGWARVADALVRHGGAAIGAPTLAETAIVRHAKGVPSTLVPALLQRVGVEILPFTAAHADAASDAYAAYGRGRQPAALDFGDCMTYAVARLAGAPLPFVGPDFLQTDLEAALP